MKKRIGLLFILLITAGCSKKTLLTFNDEEKKEQLIEVYKINEDTTIYAEFEINYQDTTLQKALETGKTSIDEIAKKMELVASLNDGGTFLLKYEPDKTRFANKSFYLVSCKKLNAESLTEKLYQNQNIYIGNSKDILNYCNEKN